MTTRATAATHSIDPDLVRDLQEDLRRVQQESRAGWPRDHLYPEQIRHPLMARSTGGRSIPSECVGRIEQLSASLFPRERIYWLGYAEQIQPSGPHIDRVHRARWPELNHSRRTVLIPLTECPDHWTCTLDLWADSDEEILLGFRRARARDPQYPDQRSLWPTLPWGMDRWIDRIRVTHRMQDQLGLLHTWDVSNVHTSAWWDWRQNDDRPTRTFLIWHTLAPGRPLPDPGIVRSTHPWID